MKKKRASMKSDDFDDPRAERSWISGQRKSVVEYLDGQKLKHGGIPDEPDWYVAPYLAIWRVMSAKVRGSVGWWAISGDVPTDYMSSGGVADARGAMSKFGEYWLELSQYMLRGEAYPNAKIGTPDQWPELGDLLSRRAHLLTQFADDDENWQD